MDGSAEVIVEQPRLTEDQLQILADRIVASLDPEEVILFGSRAYGTPTAESDVDILVVLETELPRRERAAQVYGAIAGTGIRGVQALVRTPNEIQQALAVGDFFIREIVIRGRVLYAKGPLCHPSGCDGPLDLSFPVGGEVNEVTNPLAWVERAEEDYAAARWGLRRKPAFTRLACFHIQQSVEKYFKAVLVARGQGFPKVHELPAIADLLEGLGVLVPLDRQALDTLTGYAVEPRYPGDEPSLEEARQAFHLAQVARRFVRRLLGLS